MKDDLEIAGSDPARIEVKNVDICMLNKVGVFENIRSETRRFLKHAIEINHSLKVQTFHAPHSMERTLAYVKALTAAKKLRP